MSDLASLRAKSRSLLSMTRLFDFPQLDQEGLTLDRRAVGEIILPLELDEPRASRLLEDSFLIAAWYWIPQRKDRLGISSDRHLKALRSAARYAQQLYDAIAADAQNIEELINLAPHPDRPNSRDFDLVKFSNDVGRFVLAADRTVDKPGARAGRRPDNRRNIAIALATEAVENATRQRVGISRGNKRSEDPHFVRPPGRYVAELMRLLGFNDERTLVGAFERLRRGKSVKQ